jgi:xanthine dehydrogenase accessory factor
MSIYQKIAEFEARGEPFALCTVVQSSGSTPRGTGAKMLVFQDGSFLDTIGGGEMENRVIQAALDGLADGRSRYLKYNFTDPQRGDPGVCGGQVEVYVEPNIPPPVLVVVGAGHVGKAVAFLAHWLGFRVVISDDRPGFSSPEAIPTAAEYHVGPLSALTSQVNITPWTYIVLTTRGMNIDVEGLPGLLGSKAAYIGVIGSRRRWQLAYNQMLASGVPADLLSRVHSPVGLELNAETPEEIAVSIMAEIIMLKQGGSGNQMKLTGDIAKQQPES